ncbi:MAG: hypothetical protein QGG36_07665 [Pirellulaceae bacterium]|nr:hypothetical protein [Pirellulaceae bacterium]
MQRKTIAGCCLLSCGLMASLCSAQTSYPMLMSLKPVAAQVGAVSEHEIKSRYSMFGAYEVIVEGAGVRGEIVHPEIKQDAKDKQPSLTTMKVKFHVAADAQPGVRDFRIATPRGVSTLGQLVIGGDPVIAEQGDNNSLEKAQAVKLPATVCGAIEKAEDLDVFKFAVEKGQSFSFHVRSMRLQDKIHDLQTHADPILTIRNATGGTVAASDNFFYGDPFIGHTFTDAGDYFLEIRDVRYQGNQYWEYSIEISDRPFVSNAYPLAVRAAEKTKLQLVGTQLPAEPVSEITPPANLGPVWMTLPLGGSTTNPVPLIVTDGAVASEQDDAGDQPDKAMAVEFPGGVNGRLTASGDIDCFAFDAKKGERYTFEVLARRQQSALDSHLRILDAKGKQLQLNDDMKQGKRSFADSLIENWQAPADGKYVVEIRDLHLRGGEPFLYFIRAVKAEPAFELYIDTDKTLLTPGTSGVMFVRVERKNGFAAGVDLQIEGLPAGVTAECGRILPAGKDGCIVLTAAADAKMGAANVNVFGSAKLAAGEEGAEAREMRERAAPYQETYMPGGGRGHYPVEFHTVSIGEPADLQAVELSAHEVTLRPGESATVDVKLQRAESFKNNNVTLDVQYRHLSGVYGDPLPKGVTLDGGSSKTLLTGDASDGKITLKAAADAEPVDKQMICVMANVSLNFVMKATYSSKPLLITIAPKKDAAAEPAAEK